ncbi:MAG: hypothetical protein V3T43_06175 [Nitrosomonadaceae bacterium]
MSVYLYIDGTDRTSNLERDTVVIKNQIQQRADTMTFRLLGGNAPTEWQDVRFFKGDTIASFVTKTVTLDGNFQQGVSYFWPGQVLKIRVNDSDEEEVIVDTYTESTLTIVLVAAPSGTVSTGDIIGEQLFGGTMTTPKTDNVIVAQNVEYDCGVIDYTKIFDKKLVSDTWEDVDSRYIINSFVNSTVNLQNTIDVLDFDNDAAIQAEWIEGGDGNNPTIDSSDFIEGDASGVFGWTNSSGSANWDGTPATRDLSDLVGVTSGTPTEGLMMLWGNPADFSTITDLKVRLGSSSSDYSELTLTTLTKLTINGFTYLLAKFTDAPSPTGTPDWTAVDYASIRITQTGTSSIKLNGLRVMKDRSFTLKNVLATPDLDDFRAPRTKATAVIQTLAKLWEYLWFVDYDRDIHFIDEENDSSPWDATNSDVTRLVTQIDASQVGNRIEIEGGEETSASKYPQVFAGDDTLREWLMKNKFKNMAVSISDAATGTVDTMEATTTTTTVKATAHGLAVQDHVVMIDRGDVVRELLTVPDNDTFTVEAVPSQASGDQFRLFSTAKTIGIEGIADETTVDYVENSNEKSVRATDSEATVIAGDFIRFSFNERVPIQRRYTDAASQAALEALGLGDGIFDLAPIIDQNIDSQALAISIAQAKVAQYSNPIVTGSYLTDRHGIKAGQIQNIADTNRSFDDEYVIQTVSMKQKGGKFADNFQFTVVFGANLFGWIEFVQGILEIQDKIEINSDAVVVTFVTANEIVESSDVNQVAKDGGFKSVKSAETVESADVNVVSTLATGTWRFEPNGVGQTLDTRFDLADFA